MGVSIINIFYFCLEKQLKTKNFYHVSLFLITMNKRDYISYKLFIGKLNQQKTKTLKAQNLI